jgi:hypothetical protein
MPTYFFGNLGRVVGDEGAYGQRESGRRCRRGGLFGVWIEMPKNVYFSAVHPQLSKVRGQFLQKAWAFFWRENRPFS